MGGVLGAIIAVAGTLLGGALTYFFQMRSATRAEHFATEQQRRSERLNAFSAFASAVTEFRGGQYDRWHRRREDPDSQTYLTARQEAYRLRITAQHALFVVQMLAQSNETSELANTALEICNRIARADSEDDMDTHGVAAQDAISAFIVRASRELN